MKTLLIALLLASTNALAQYYPQQFDQPGYNYPGGQMDYQRQLQQEFLDQQFMNQQHLLNL